MHETRPRRPDAASLKPSTRPGRAPAMAIAALLAGACGDDTRPTEDVIPDDVVADVQTDTTPVDTTPDGTVTDAADDVTDDTGGDTAPDTMVTWPALVINEVAPAGAPADWIELHNPTGDAVNLEGWVFRDSDDAHGFTFPAGATVEAGGWLVVEEGPEGFDFGIGAADGARLFAPDTTLIDATEWTAETLPRAANWGRLPDGTGEFTPLFIPTRGAANVPNPDTVCGNEILETLEVCDTDDFGGDTCEARGWGGGALACADGCTRIDTAGCTAREAGLVINEVTSSGDDRIELYNGSTAAIDLEGWMLTDEGGGAWLMPPGTSIEAGAWLVFIKDVHHTFGLGGSDAVELSDPDGAVVDRIGWASGQAAVSYCRRPNGTGGFEPCPSASFGGENF